MEQGTVALDVWMFRCLGRPVFVFVHLTRKIQGEWAGEGKRAGCKRKPLTKVNVTFDERRPFVYTTDLCF